MTVKTKGRADCHQATLDTATYTTNSTGLAAWIKVTIINLALKGMVSKSVARWLIKVGGLRHA
ncbi:hypothetical protein [uncultured Spongiibacter sp.]|uniref:hypothetical protein n=1 Tax=uncultured Spongiibacter sp. TaxID=870896 RepID=UPI002596FB1A|nr:hypothetical protein [uncultured Spongiibacter sp.]